MPPPMTTFALPDDAHALIRDAYHYWLRIHPDANGETGRLPGRQHFDPLDIPRLLTHVWMVDVEPGDQPVFRYRVVGSAVDHSLGLKLTGRRLDDVMPDFLTNPELSAPYLAILRDSTPRYRKGAPVFAHNRQFRLMERLAMPLARDGRTIDMLFCITLYYLPEGTIIGVDA